MTTDVQEHPWEAPLDEGYWQALLHQEEQAPPAPEAHPAEVWPEAPVRGEGAVVGPEYEMGRRLEPGSSVRQPFDASTESRADAAQDRADARLVDTRADEWRWLSELYENRDVVSARAIGCNKGGLLVRLGGAIGFVPASQLSNVPECLGTEELRGELEAMVGQEIQVKLIVPAVDAGGQDDIRLARFEDNLPPLVHLPSVGDLETTSEPGRQPPAHGWFGDVLADHAHYYSGKNLGMLAVGVGVAAVMANTKLDASLQNSYQKNVRGTHTDEISEAVHTPRVLGNGYITIPAFVGAALVGSWFDEVPLGDGVGEWGQRSLRTLLVGAPPLLAMQLATGASRPGETGGGSRWRPFQDNNGVSGHSFMGAVPFLAAAKMTDDPFWKTAFFAGSTLAGLSRINDGGHYPSQVALGWWMAYVAASAVDDTQRATKNLTFFPLPMADGIGAGLEYRW